MVDIGTTLRRALRSWTLYSGRRDSVRGTLNALREQLATAGDGGRVVFRFTPGAILVGDVEDTDDEAVADAVVFVAFRDGVRALAVEPTIPDDELATLVGILASGNERQRNQADDVVAQLWAANLPHVGVSAVDPYADVELEEDTSSSDALATDLMPHVLGRDADASGDSVAFGRREKDESNDATAGTEARGLGEDASPQTMADIVTQQLMAWRVPPASVPPPRGEGPPAMRFPRRAAPVDWNALGRDREGARVALAIERIVACHVSTVSSVDALMQVTLDAWRFEDGRALVALVGQFPALPGPTLERWRSTLSMNMVYTTAVQTGLIALASSAPNAVAEWFRLAGVTHLENVARAIFAGRSREIVEAWLRVAPECALVALQQWVGAETDDAWWATGCAIGLPSDEARTLVLRKALAHRDAEVQFSALQALSGDVATETNAAIERSLQSGRRDRMQYVLRELSQRSDGESSRLLLAYVEGSSYNEVPAVQRAAVLDVLLAKAAPEVVDWVRERTVGWGWRLALRGRERNAEIAAALQRLPPDIRKAYP